MVETNVSRRGVSSQASPTSLQVRPATPQDVSEMSTIFNRSFHPVSEYMQRCFPDTPMVRRWWEQVHGFAIRDPDVQLMVVTDSARNGEIIALGRWRKFNEANQDQKAPLNHQNELVKPDGNLSAGTWSLLALSPDSDQAFCNAFINFLAQTRATYMQKRTHILLELVLTVHERKGSGAGRLLLEILCKEADEAGLEIFVETNGPVVAFYEKFGFSVRDRLAMPGGLGYEETILVREPDREQHIDS